MSEHKQQFNFVSQLSAMPAEGLARIPILVTGSWVKGGREVSFTREELCTAIDNFQKLANHDLNVDYDHACEDLERAAGEPTPSAGRILALDEPEEFRDSGSGTRDSGRQTQALSDESRAPSPESRYILYGRYEPTARARQTDQEPRISLRFGGLRQGLPRPQNGRVAGLDAHQRGADQSTVSG